MPTQSLQPQLNQADYQIGTNKNFRKRPMTCLEDEKSKSFAAYSPGEARSAATQWLSDFTDHGPLRIMSIRVTEERGLFVATVAYSEMTVESSPRYFADHKPSTGPKDEGT